MVLSEAQINDQHKLHLTRKEKTFHSYRFAQQVGKQAQPCVINQGRIKDNGRQDLYKNRNCTTDATGE